MQRSTYLLITLAAASMLGGCGWRQQSQVTRLQDEKRQLVERVGYEVKLKQELEVENSKLLARVSQAERELADFVAKSNGAPGSGEMVAGDSAAADGRMLANQMLQTLQARYAEIQYDPSKGAFRYGNPIAFPGSTAELSDDGKAKLDQMAALLSATGVSGKVHLLIAASSAPGEAKSSGSAATGDIGISAKRAAQVASYLRLRGIPESTISALSYTADNPAAAGVQVFLTPNSAAATALHNRVNPAAGESR